MERWLASFRACLAATRASILARGGIGHCPFPVDDAEARVVFLLERGAPPAEIAEAGAAPVGAARHDLRVGSSAPRRFGRFVGCCALLGVARRLR